MQPRYTKHGRLQTNYYDVNGDFVFLWDSWTEKNPVHEYHISRIPAADVDKIDYEYRSMAKERSKSTGYPPHEVAEMFKDNPEAIADAKRNLKAYQEELDVIEQEEWDTKRRLENNSSLSFGDAQFATALVNAGNYGYRKAFLEENIGKLKKILLFLSPSASTIAQSLKDKELLKLIPIDAFIAFDNGNKACCIWHDEKSPSMQYYPENNNVYCFGCNTYGDVIQVVMQLHDVDFQGALAVLSEYGAQ